MSKYEVDYDDEGNEIRVKVTRKMLRERADDGNSRANAAYGALTTARARAAAAERRVANLRYGHRIGEALGDGHVIAVQTDLQPGAMLRDITGFWAVHVTEMIDTRDCRLLVEFRGDAAALGRLSETLMKGDAP